TVVLRHHGLLCSPDSDRPSSSTEAMIRTCGWPSARRAEAGTPSRGCFGSQQALIRTGVGALVREGTPMVKVAHDANTANNDGGTGKAGRSVLDEIAREGPGRCSPQPYTPRSPTTSRPLPARSTT